MITLFSCSPLTWFMTKTLCAALKCSFDQNDSFCTENDFQPGFLQTEGLQLRQAV